MSALTFAERHVGTVVTAPGGQGGQCVDLANLYLFEEYRLPHVWANAYDWRNASIKGFRWVQNSPTNWPVIGSLAVWGYYPPHGIARDGHIALVMVADSMRLLTFDQNWPDGEGCLFNVHDYGGVIGWHAPLP